MESKRMNIAIEINKACEGVDTILLQELACEFVKYLSIETVLRESKQILSILYPSYEMHLSPNQDAAVEKEYQYPFKLNEQALSSLLIHSICMGIISFDKSQKLRTGADRLMKLFPNPLPKPTSPFCDEDPYLFGNK
jgi:hypothetical protein